MPWNGRLDYGIEASGSHPAVLSSLGSVLDTADSLTGPEGVYVARYTRPGRLPSKVRINELFKLSLPQDAFCSRRHAEFRLLLAECQEFLLEPVEVAEVNHLRVLHL